MSQDRIQGLVLEARPLREQDKLVTILTRERGIIRAVAPGASRFRNRFGPLFELFTEGDFIFHQKENQNLVTISRGDILHSYFFTLCRGNRIFFFYLMAEVIIRFVPQKGHSRRIYRLMKSILDLPEGAADPDVILLYFLVWVLRIEGLLFPVDRCSSCRGDIRDRGWLRKDCQGLLCPVCHTDEEAVFDRKIRSFIRWSRSRNPARLDQFGKIPNLRSMIRCLLSIIEHHGEFSLRTARYLPAGRPDNE